MATTHRSRVFSPGVSTAAGMLVLACGGQLDYGNDDAGGNTSAAGGAIAAQGGTSASGGAFPLGGKVATGGSKYTGGASPAGGKSPTGGSKATGGASAGGSKYTGGSSPTGGKSATGGSKYTGGTTAQGGTTTTGGTIATGGTNGEGTAFGLSCPGCLKLYVPLATANTGTEFEVDYGTSTTLDLSDMVVTAHLYVDTAGTAGGLRMYAKNDDFANYATIYSNWQNLSNLDGSWHDVRLDLSQVVSAPYPNPNNVFDKSMVRWIGFDISAGAAFDGGIFDPVIVYVDWIKFSVPYVADAFAFTTTVEGFTINANNVPLPGSTITWYGQ
jgi:hypothetical protein